MKSALFIFVILIIFTGCEAHEPGYINASVPLPEILKESGADAGKISILIDKSEHKLSVHSDTIILKEYPVVFGGNPKDDKLMQGDQCTPEGSFKILSKYPHKSWSKFIWIGYPSDDSWRKHNLAKSENKIPKDAKIGGEIGIHGVPDGMDYLIDMKYNWTLGCVSMKNRDVDEIYPYINKTTVIEIRK